jgi:hypothetical protein
VQYWEETSSYINFNEIIDDDAIINEEPDDYLKLPAYDLLNECLTRKSRADITYLLIKATRHADLRNELKMIFSLFVALNRFNGAVAHRGRTEFEQWCEILKQMISK